jgi:hypothetical protein
LVQGVRNRRADSFPLLLAGSTGVFLVLFSIRVPVYDGERLSLLVFPHWAILIGRGFASAWSAESGRAGLKCALKVVLIVQGYGVVALHPFGLSYENALGGGLPSDVRLGLELTYWGDAVERVLLDSLMRDLSPDAPAALAPTLYPGQGAHTTNRAMSAAASYSRMKGPPPAPLGSSSTAAPPTGARTPRAPLPRPDRLHPIPPGRLAVGKRGRWG